MNNNFYYSYIDFIRERANFKMVDRTGVNRYDTPAALFYKLVFYFNDDNGLLGLNGILDGSDDLSADASKISKITAAFKGKGNDEEQTSAKNEPVKNTAYDFLLLNDELERAEYLKRFLILLSEINSESPWYFQELSGLDGALERKLFSDGEVKLEDSKRQITIKCLNDAYDNRIGTLLDLYKSACFSYQNKKEIVPANLRKFNMGVLLFDAPIRGKGGKSGDKGNRIEIPESNTDYYVPSVKLIELRNCEFDYNSAKSAFGTINTSEGPFSPEYTITINFDDCYESRYNEALQEVVTDFIRIDLQKERNNGEYIKVHGTESYPDVDALKILNADKNYWDNTNYNGNAYAKGVTGTEYASVKPENAWFGMNVLTTQVNNAASTVSQFTQLPSFGVNELGNIHDNGTISQIGIYEYLNRTKGLNGPLGGAVTQVAGTALTKTIEPIKKLYLGNIYGITVSDIVDTAKKIAQGDVFGTVGNIQKMTNSVNNNSEKKQKESEKPKMQKLSGYIAKQTTERQAINQKLSAANNL